MGLYKAAKIRYDNGVILLGKKETVLYTPENLADNRAQLRRRLIWLGIPAVILLIGVVVSFIVRIKLLTMGLTVLLGAFCIFAYGMLLSPVICYGRHLDEALYGRKRESTGKFKEMEEQPVWRDGVLYYPMMINVGDKDAPEDDRLFYFDAYIQRPAWQPGDVLTVSAHDKAVAAWSIN